MMEWFYYGTCFAKIFLLPLFHNIHQVRCYHFYIVEIVAESVNLIQMSKQNRKLLSPWWRTIRFLWKSTYQNTEQDVLVIFLFARNKEFQLIWQKLYSRELTLYWYIITILFFFCIILGRHFDDFHRLLIMIVINHEKQTKWFHK